MTSSKCEVKSEARWRPLSTLHLSLRTGHFSLSYFLHPLSLVLILLLVCGTLRADPPTANYLFPAGGQRGTKVEARLGGCNLHDAPRLIWSGSGVVASEKPLPTERIWFEGPVIPQPASQRSEDYPRDFIAALALAPDAPLGLQTWRLATSQGVTSAWGFVVGDFPEVLEDEVDGAAPPVRVELPVTINGRIFPREDVDAWSFTAKAGQTVTCFVATSVFGSPLDARLEVRGPAGRALAEQLPEGSSTPPLRFVAPSDGEYQVRLHDTAFGGLQDHVYRLTVTAGPCLDSIYPLGGRRGSTTRFELTGVNLPKADATITLPTEGTEFVHRLDDTKAAWGEVRLDLDDFDEVLEAEPNELLPQTFPIPSVLNGRVQRPGDADVWRFAAKKGVEYEFEARAARLGSPLDAVLELADADGKRLAEADDSPGMQTDARVRWTAPADGEFRLIVKDRLASRGDARFAYRIRAISAEQPEFSLNVMTDTVIVERGRTSAVKVAVERGPGFKEPVAIEVEGLPAGVSVGQPTVIAPNQKDIQLQLKAEATAPVAAVAMKVIGRAKVGEWELVRTALPLPTPAPANSNTPVVASGSLWLGVSVPTPFKFVGAFETKFIARGAVFVRQYRVERNGFEGPLEVRLADRQGRHLQGVTASPVTVPAGQTEFEFAVSLPSWMEIGRTCRSTLAVSGIVTDPDGSQHSVSYSSNDQNNQMIALVDPGRLALQLSRTSLTATPGQRVEVPVRLQRDRELKQPVSVELLIPRGCRGVSAKPVEVAGDQAACTLVVEFTESLTGIELRPLTIRATTRDERGLPVTAESPLLLVASPK